MGQSSIQFQFYGPCLIRWERYTDRLREGERERESVSWLVKMTGVDKRVQRCQLSHQNILYTPYIRILTPAVTGTQGYPHQLAHRHRETHTSCHTDTGIPTPAVTRTQGYPHQLSHGHRDTHASCHMDAGIVTPAVTRTQGYPH